MGMHQWGDCKKMELCIHRNHELLLLSLLLSKHLESSLAASLHGWDTALQNPQSAETRLQNLDFSWKKQEEILQARQMMLPWPLFLSAVWEPQLLQFSLVCLVAMKGTTQSRSGRENSVPHTVWMFWISFNIGWLRKNGSCRHISWKTSGGGASWEGGNTGQGRSPTSLGRPPCPSLCGALLMIRSHWCSSNTASNPEKELMAAV